MRSSLLKDFQDFLQCNLLMLAWMLAGILLQSHSFLHTVSLPWRVVAQLIATGGAHLLIIATVSLVQTFLLYGIRTRSDSRILIQRCFFAIAVLTILSLCLLNAILFPGSLFSSKPATSLSPTGLMITFLVVTAPLGLLAIHAVLVTMFRWPLRFTGLVAGCLLLLLVPVAPLQPVVKPGKPDIILIGVDSLGPGHVHAQDTPAISRFLEQGVWFTNTITPLARTYPSWTTLLTGLYPVHHGARYNLLPPEKVRRDRSIAWFLQEQGYQTRFATDDRRFSSLGKDFGFQEVIGPALGINDFLLATFNDFIPGNLLVNSAAGKWLFPWNHLNRAGIFSYYPETFDATLERSLREVDRNRPLFMAVHFTLPHWPYSWAIHNTSILHARNSNDPEASMVYQQAVRRADTEVADFLENLKQAGLLENAVVVLLSDHGETLYTPGSRPLSEARYRGEHPGKLAAWFANHTETVLDKTAGHGSDLLSPNQFHCLLGFQRYRHGKPVWAPNTVNTRISLLDVAPTLYALLRQSADYKQDGISLYPTLTRQHPLPERRFFLESGELPNQFPTPEKARAYAKQLFHVDGNSGRMELTGQGIAFLDTLKLYGVIDGDWLMALYPDGDTYIPVSLNLRDGTWTDTIRTTFHPDAIELLGAMEYFFQRVFAQAT